MKALLRFAFWATLLFAAAWVVATPYQKWIVSLAGHTVAPAGSEIEWGDIEVFFPFDLSVYVALCLASSWASWRTRLRVTALGLVALVGFEWLTLVVVLKVMMMSAGRPEAEQEATQRFAIAVIRLTGLVASGFTWLYLLGWQRMPELVRSFASRTTAARGGKR